MDHEEKIETLSRALDILKINGGKHWSPYGWGSGEEGKTSNMCAISAVGAAMPREKPLNISKVGGLSSLGVDERRAVEELNCELRKGLPAGFTGVPIYNDHKSTTREDVIALFERTIQRLINEREKVDVPVKEREETCSPVQKT